MYINDIKINWIDAKNFYGSNIRFTKQKTIKQISKYINEYGTGTIIYKLGFSDKLEFEKTVLMGFDEIKKVM